MQQEVNELESILTVQEENNAQLREKLELLSTFQTNLSTRLDTVRVFYICTYPRFYTMHAFK